jgi:23S rRNA (adenine2503-C2)-methyltransferase
MKSITEYDKTALTEKLTGENPEIKPFRVKQILEWVYVKNVSSFDLMTNISKELRNYLSKNFKISSLTLTDKVLSKDKQAVKYLFKTHDNHFIESVRIIHPDRSTLCISSMAGCPLGCTFCATSKMGLRRILTAAEITDQFLNVYREGPVDNVVFMGMGEPLLNTDNVFDAIDVLSDKELLNFSQRRFTISTAGVIKGIKAFIDSRIKSNLAVSLNSPFQEEREKMMPLTKTNPLAKLYDVLKEYNKKCGRFTFEYIILPEVNNSKKYAAEILRLNKDLNFNLNVIGYNSFEEGEYKNPTEEEINRFMGYFKGSSLEVVRRLSKGSDIAAGCGQLAAKKA